VLLLTRQSAGYAALVQLQALSRPCCWLAWQLMPSQLLGCVLLLLCQSLGCAVLLQKLVV
jgi:hypothetical protein